MANLGGHCHSKRFPAALFFQPGKTSERFFQQWKLPKEIFSSGKISAGIVTLWTRCLKMLRSSAAGRLERMHIFFFFSQGSLNFRLGARRGRDGGGGGGGSVCSVVAACKVCLLTWADGCKMHPLFFRSLRSNPQPLAPCAALTCSPVWSKYLKWSWDEGQLSFLCLLPFSMPVLYLNSACAVFFVPAGEGFRRAAVRETNIAALTTTSNPSLISIVSLGCSLYDGHFDARSGGSAGQKRWVTEKKADSTWSSFYGGPWKKISPSSLTSAQVLSENATIDSNLAQSPYSIEIWTIRHY